MVHGREEPELCIGPSKTGADGIGNTPRRTSSSPFRSGDQRGLGRPEGEPVPGPAVGVTETGQSYPWKRQMSLGSRKPLNVHVFEGRARHRLASCNIPHSVPNIATNMYTSMKDIIWVPLSFLLPALLVHPRDENSMMKS